MPPTPEGPARQAALDDLQAVVDWLDQNPSVPIPTLEGSAFTPEAVAAVCFDDDVSIARIGDTTAVTLTRQIGRYRLRWLTNLGLVSDREFRPAPVAFATPAALRDRVAGQPAEGVES